MNRPRRIKALKPVDLMQQRMIAEAAYFTAVQFLGRGKYDRRECDTLADAERIGGAMRTANGKAVLLYAVNAEGRSWPLRCIG